MVFQLRLWQRAKKDEASKKAAEDARPKSHAEKLQGSALMGGGKDEGDKKGKKKAKKKAKKKESKAVVWGGGGERVHSTPWL